MAAGYTEIKHSIWDVEMSMEERYMMMYLLDCENKFNKIDEWFGLTDADFINIGFGRDKVVLRRARNSLVNRKWIEFKKGKVGQKSIYRIIRKTES